MSVHIGDWTSVRMAQNVIRTLNFRTKTKIAFLKKSESLVCVHFLSENYCLCVFIDLHSITM